MKNKLFIVRKYVWAASASQAISKEKLQKVDDVWVDDNWKNMQTPDKTKIGFFNEK